MRTRSVSGVRQIRWNFGCGSAAAGTSRALATSVSGTFGGGSPSGFGCRLGFCNQRRAVPFGTLARVPNGGARGPRRGCSSALCRVSEATRDGRGHVSFSRRRGRLDAVLTEADRRIANRKFAARGGFAACAESRRKPLKSALNAGVPSSQKALASRRCSDTRALSGGARHALALGSLRDGGRRWAANPFANDADTI
jgi:hypothetical protein